jgi:nitrate reductase molybdenum cofactor assembly chaperone NarJ/NarW
MDEESRLICGLVSRLLAYPDEEGPKSASRIEEAAKRIPGCLRAGLYDFLGYLKKTPLISLQEEYTRTFDLNPSLCLNLTYHLWGDDKKRSSALVDLMKIYRDGGYEILEGELPDFLPMLLEFLSVCPENSCFPLYEKYGDQLALIASRLRDMQSPYARLFEVLDSALRR